MFFFYLKSSFLQDAPKRTKLFPGFKYTDGSYGSLFLNDLNSKIVNGVRLRQVRVKSGMAMINTNIFPNSIRDL